MRVSRGHRRNDAEEEVLRLVREHAADLLRFARRYSLCADDAQDAYQRAMEILVRRMRDEPPQNPLSWVRTVIRHECGAVRDQRLLDVGREELDLERHEGRELDDPAHRVERFEELAHAAEALRRLKPQEVTALALRAEGLSYHEICARTGWSYTRTNRTVTEGRRALITRIEAIESGAECERWVPLLSLLADGEASARDLAELRPHLRSCGACRATLRTFHAAPRQIGELVPTALLPVTVAGLGGGSGLGIGRHLEGLLHAVSERAAFGAMRMQGALDALPGTKVAAVAASTVAIAGGGAAIEQVATRAGEPHGATRSNVNAMVPRSPSGSAFAAMPATGGLAPIPASRAAALGPEDVSTPASAGPVPDAEFGFESTATRGRERHAEGPILVARAAATPGAPRRQRGPARRPEFGSTAPSESLAAAASSTPAATPSSPPATAAAPPIPSEPAPPEFAGP